MKYVKSDKEIEDSIKALKPLSSASADKIKSFFLNNKEFQSFALNLLTSRAKDSKCMDSIKEETKKKVLKIILDQWDFSNIFLSSKHNEEINNKQNKDIIDILYGENDIRPLLEKCFGKK